MKQPSTQLIRTRRRTRRLLTRQENKAHLLVTILAISDRCHQAAASLGLNLEVLVSSVTILSIIECCEAKFYHGHDLGALDSFSS